MRRVLGVGAMLLVLEFLVLPQVAGARKALHTLLDVDIGLLVVAVALEAASLLAYAQLTRTTLPCDDRPSFSTILRIDLSTLAVSHLVPGGSAAGAALGYRLLTGAGVSAADTGFTLALQGLGSAVVLNVLLWLGLVVSIPLRGFNPLYGTAALVGAAFLAFLAIVIVGLTRGEDRSAKILCHLAGRSRILDADRVHDGVHRVADRIRELGRDRDMVLRATAWASANWLLSAGSLGVFLLAFGHRIGPDGLLVSYGLANVLAAIPITPGGLGVTEAVLIALLVGFGTPRGVAVLAVVSYRLVNFWLPIPVGAAAYLSLRRSQSTPGGRGADELAQVAEQARREAEQRRAWAARKGIRLGPDEPPPPGSPSAPPADVPDG